MSRIALLVFLALASAGLAAALSGSAATAGGYGGYDPYYGGYGQPCCVYVPPPPPPPPCCAPTPYYSAPYAVPPPAPLPPPPLLGAEGPKYYSSVGAGPAVAPCYRQNVRVPDRYGGWTWGVKHGCDPY